MASFAGGVRAEWAPPSCAVASAGGGSARWNARSGRTVFSGRRLNAAEKLLAGRVGGVGGVGWVVLLPVLWVKWSGRGSGSVGVSRRVRGCCVASATARWFVGFCIASGSSAAGCVETGAAAGAIRGVRLPAVSWPGCPGGSVSIMAARKCRVCSK